MALAKNIKVVVLLGAPGSGKGTQAKFLATKNPGWVHISTGDLFRAEISSQSPLGQSVKSIIDSGKLVSDDLTTQVFEAQVLKIIAEKKPVALILDGYPRTKAQAQSLMAFTAKHDRLCEPLAVEMVVGAEEVVSRLEGRLINPRNGRIYHEKTNPPKKPMVCDDDGGALIKRSDDNRKTILERYSLYEEQRDGLVSVLSKGQKPLVKVDGLGALDAVSTRLKNAIG